MFHPWPKYPLKVKIFTLFFIISPFLLLFSTSVRLDMFPYKTSDDKNMKFQGMITLTDLNFTRIPYSLKGTTSNRSSDNFSSDNPVDPEAEYYYLWLNFSQNSIISGDSAIFPCNLTLKYGFDYPNIWAKIWRDITHPPLPYEETIESTFYYDSDLNIYRTRVSISSYSQFKGFELILGIVTSNYSQELSVLREISWANPQIPFYYTDLIRSTLLALVPTLIVVLLHRNRRNNHIFSEIVKKAEIAYEIERKLFVTVAYHKYLLEDLENIAKLKQTKPSESSNQHLTSKNSVGNMKSCKNNPREPNP